MEQIEGNKVGPQQLGNDDSVNNLINHFWLGDKPHSFDTNILIGYNNYLSSVHLTNPSGSVLP